MSKRKKRRPFATNKARGPSKSDLKRFAMFVCRERQIEYHNRPLADMVADLDGRGHTHGSALEWCRRNLRERFGSGKICMERVADIETAILKAEGKPVPERDFYQTRIWQALRFRALQKSNGCCVLCGRSHRVDGVKLHVDHIKPKSRFPALALDPANLQVLCEDCNLGKGNRDTTDWGELTDEERRQAERLIIDEADKAAVPS